MLTVGQLLGEVKAHAMLELRTHGITVDRVLTVDDDSIVYERNGRAMTAWKRRIGGILQIRYEVGMPAAPSANIEAMFASLADGRSRE